MLVFTVLVLPSLYAVRGSIHAILMGLGLTYTGHDVKRGPKEFIMKTMSPRRAPIRNVSINLGRVLAHLA